MDELTAYKNQVFNRISLESDSNEVFPEESYFEYVSEMLSDAGILDNVEYYPCLLYTSPSPRDRG